MANKSRKPVGDPAPANGAKVPDGWTAPTWAAELRRKADRCQDSQPELAERYRRTAAAMALQA